MKEIGYFLLMLITGFAWLADHANKAGARRATYLNTKKISQEKVTSLD